MIKVKQKKLKYKTITHMWLSAIKNNKIFWWKYLHSRKASIIETKEDQRYLLENLVEFNNKSRPKNKEDKDKKRDTSENTYALYEGWKLTINAFKSETFPLKPTKGKGLKILTPKQALQRLPIALAQVYACNTSENLLNEIR